MSQSSRYLQFRHEPGTGIQDERGRGDGHGHGLGDMQAPGRMETKSGQYWLPKWRTRLIQPVAWPLAWKLMSWPLCVFGPSST